MIESAFVLILIGSGIIFLFMTILWLIHFSIKNAAIVDVGWSYSLAILALFYAFFGPGSEKATVLAIIVSIWAVRLGTYLFFTRIFRAQEEGRYIALRESWKTNIGLKFFLFYQAQAILDIFLSVPFFIVALNPEPGFSIFEITGLSLFIIAFSGESIADWQLHTFKRNSENKGKVCNIGLWYYSRHPNYFFEFLIWVSFFIFALGSPYGWISILAPLTILFFLFRITGIPATEEQAVRSKGNLYIEYQRTTSMFIPWVKKNNA